MLLKIKRQINVQHSLQHDERECLYCIIKSISLRSEEFFSMKLVIKWICIDYFLHQCVIGMSVHCVVISNYMKAIFSLITSSQDKCSRSTPLPLNSRQNFFFTKRGNRLRFIIDCICEQLIESQRLKQASVNKMEKEHTCTGNLQ